MVLGVVVIVAVLCYIHRAKESLLYGAYSSET